MPWAPGGQGCCRACHPAVPLPRVTHWNCSEIQACWGPRLAVYFPGSSCLVLRKSPLAVAGDGGQGGLHVGVRQAWDGRAGSLPHRSGWRAHGPQASDTGVRGAACAVLTEVVAMGWGLPCFWGLFLLPPDNALSPGCQRERRLQRLLLLRALHPQHQPAGAADRDHRCLQHPDPHPQAVQAPLQHLYSKWRGWG